MTRYKCPNCGGSNTYGGDPYPCSRCDYDGRVSAPSTVYCQPNDARGPDLITAWMTEEVDR